MERIVVTHIRDDLCLVTHEDVTLSAHSSEHEALSMAFAFAARRLGQGHEAMWCSHERKAPSEPHSADDREPGTLEESGRAHVLFNARLLFRAGAPTGQTLARPAGHPHSTRQPRNGAGARSLSSAVSRGSERGFNPMPR